jgi:hypothetical protein
MIHRKDAEVQRTPIRLLMFNTYVPQFCQDATIRFSLRLRAFAVKRFLHE